MSKIALTPDPSGTGTFAIASPNSNTNRTLTLPDGSGTLATVESTLSQFNATGDAPVYACRAWVNFNGTGTVAIRASGNVSSITDHGVGEYTINFTTAMPDTNYAAVMTGQGRTGTDSRSTLSQRSDVAQTTSSIRIAQTAGVGSTDYLLDTPIATLAIFR